MSEMRSLIRELIAEEIRALKRELAGTAGPSVERVRVGCSDELTAFALSVLDRAEDPAFAEALREGRLRFAPEVAQDHRPAPAPMPRYVPPPAPAAQPRTLVTTVPQPVPELRKSLVTERDIAAIASGETRLRIGKSTRVTPLAADEAQRRGIRIERTLA